MYIFPNQPPGIYTVAVQAPGFSPFEVQDFAITTVTTLDVPMTVTLETQRVDVESDTSGVTTDPSANPGAVVLRGEDLEALSDDPDQLEQDLQALAGPAAGPNGGQIFVDGFSGGRVPPKSSIREIRINTNPFSAEHDRLGFGRIEIFTRPGSDKFRGQVMTSFSDNLLNSRNPFVAEKPDYQSRMFMGSLSGPLGKKTSFSLETEHRGTDEFGIINATVLDADYRPVQFTDAVLTPQTRWSIIPRLDLQLNGNNTLTARYTLSRMVDENNGVGNFSLASRAYDVWSTNHNLQITETAILSPTLINETRLQFLRSTDRQVGDNAVPTVVVQDAFTGGGAQIGVSGADENRWELQNLTTMTRGTHTLKFGARLRTVSLNDTSPQNFGGTFTFGSVVAAPVLDENFQPVLGSDGSVLIAPLTSIERYRRTEAMLANGLEMVQIRLLGGGASQFSISGGNPLATVQQTDFGVFALDDWRFRPNLTLSFGLRYEGQSNISDYSNISPRFSFAWGLDQRGAQPGKTVLRGGFGVFYDRVDEMLTLQAQRFNGSLQEQYIVPNPNFYPNVPSLDTLSENKVTQTVRQLAQDIRAPYIAQTALSLDRQLFTGTTSSLTYTFSRGVHMLRTRNINAPLATGERPYVNMGNIYQFESTGTMRQHQLMTNLRTQLFRRINLFGFYMLNFARGDTDNVNTFPATSYDLSTEWGPTIFDVRHRAFVGGSINVPFGISLNPFVTASSGAPFNITTGRDNNFDTQFNDRPSFATSGTAGAIATAWGLLNPSPAPGEELIPRNHGRGPAQFSVNLRASKTWGFGNRAEGSSDGPGIMGGPRTGGRGPGGGGGVRMGGGGDVRMGGPPGGGMFGGSSGRRYNLTLSVSARNLLNYVNLSTPVGNLGSPFFGESTSLGGGFGPFGASAAANRRIDLQLRFSF
jgi:hypothetical protein